MLFNTQIFLSLFIINKFENTSYCVHLSKSVSSVTLKIKVSAICNLQLNELNNFSENSLPQILRPILYSFFCHDLHTE